MKRLVTLLALAATIPALAQKPAVDPETLIAAILTADRIQRDAVHDATFKAVYVEGETEDGRFAEKVRILKDVFVRYTDDTAYYAERFSQLYLDGELQDSARTAREQAERLEKKIQRKGKDISWDVLQPFRPRSRQLYDISYRGIVEGVVEGCMCHCFHVTAKQDSEDLIDGDYYFETESFHPSRIDFAPAQLVKKAMFRLTKLQMSLLFAPTAEGYWLPSQFDISGKGRAALLIGVEFGGTETYRVSQINSGLSDELFGVSHGQ